MDAELKLIVKELLQVDRQDCPEAISKLQTYVAKTQLDKTETIGYFQLWKAFFFALWSAHTPALQRRLAATLFQLIHHIPHERIHEWTDAFFFVLMQEWDKIDCYRVDKFYLYVRMFIAESFFWLKHQHWESTSIQKITSSWALGPLQHASLGRSCTYGVAYQLVDALIEEYNTEMSTYQPQINDFNIGECTVQIIEVFLHSLCESKDKPLIQKILKKIISKLNPEHDGELESVAKILFQKAAMSSGKKDLRPIYQALAIIDEKLATVNKKVDYARISENIQLPPQLQINTDQVISTVNTKLKEKKIKKRKVKREPLQKSTNSITLRTRRKKFQRHRLKAIRNIKTSIKS